MSRAAAGGRVVIGHLFPDELNLYGDHGNVETLVRRAAWRGIVAEVRGIRTGDDALLRGVDILFIGGGADRHQRAVSEGLIALAPALRGALADGAALLAVCAGYQNLGHVYRSPLVGEVRGPGLLDVETDVPVGVERIVGGVVVELAPEVPVAATGSRRLVGFENHSGHTRLGPSMRPLGQVLVGRGNDSTSRTEGAIALPGEGGVAGLRIGTYLHGPLLPRNPHLADLVLAAGMGRGKVTALSPLPDEREWLAHRTFEADWTAIKPGVHRRSRIGRSAERLRSLIGF